MDTFFIFSARYLYLLPVLIFVGYFVARPWSAQKRMAIFALPAGLLAYAVGLIGNYAYYDPRPFVVGHFTPLIAHAADNGFPSDHTLLVSALAMVGTYWNARLGALLWSIAVVVAIARVYVGVHHPLDVAGSIVISALTVSMVFCFFKYIWHREVL